MILLESVESVNRFWDAFSDMEAIIEGSMKFILLRTHEVETMVFSLNYHEAGEALRAQGYDYVLPIFNNLPDAIEASRDFKFSILVIGHQDRKVMPGEELTKL